MVSDIKHFSSKCYTTHSGPYNLKSTPVPTLWHLYASLKLSNIEVTENVLHNIKYCTEAHFLAVT